MRKALVVSTYEEFQRIGREKLGLGKAEPIRVVLESDGTQVLYRLDTNYYICTNYFGVRIVSMQSFGS